MAAADVEFRCFVGGPALATDDGPLKKLSVALVKSSNRRSIINDRETGRSRGFGFVTFRDEKSMKDAIEGRNGQNLDGRNITVNEAQSRKSGGGCGGFGGVNGGYNRGCGGYSGRQGGYGGGGRREGGYGNGGGYGGGRREGGYGDGGSRFSRGGGDSEGNWRS
ncbi:Glycine-rich RNA-binding protein GRP2A [Hibiscus syriacus]|uniref:Glycine-rich RNA-binding protein GRP2A n=1 Tax=Hibiscus syriacus TaxID=106335 RepID=A0A6A3BSE5_HIBSY|nr:Glycine-rich RNA-binding protein GRP2A [Hibiscus syriacus]